MTGPNILPIAAVPRDWIANRPIRIAIEIGSTRCSKTGLTTVSPSTAESTDTAGVIIASPKNSAVAVRPNSDMT